MFIINAIKKTFKFYALGTLLALLWLGLAAVAFKGDGLAAITLVPRIWLGFVALSVVAAVLLTPFALFWTFIVGIIGAGVAVGNKASR